VASEEALSHKVAYLNGPALIARAVVYFAIWIALSFCLSRWSQAQDRDQYDPGQSLLLARRMRTASGLGLVLYGLTITFASIDWGMSLEPLWYSTMFPPLYAVGQMLEAIALTTLVVIAMQRTSLAARLIPPVRLRDFGNLTLVFVMFWAYLSFSQFLLIWSENLPQEIPWYLHRVRGGWQWVAILLLTLQFALPFLLLLSRDVKQKAERLTAVVSLVLVMRFVDLVWWVEASYGDGLSFALLFDLAAWAGMGGIWLWRFGAELNRFPLLPLGSPELADALQEEAAHE
jgi:hypothetical protein